MGFFIAAVATGGISAPAFFEKEAIGLDRAISGAGGGGFGGGGPEGRLGREEGLFRLAYAGAMLDLPGGGGFLSAVCGGAGKEGQDGPELPGRRGYLL